MAKRNEYDTNWKSINERFHQGTDSWLLYNEIFFIVHTIVPRRHLWDYTVYVVVVVSMVNFLCKYQHQEYAVHQKKFLQKYTIWVYHVYLPCCSKRKKQGNTMRFKTKLFLLWKKSWVSISLNNPPNRCWYCIPESWMYAP